MLSPFLLKNSDIDGVLVLGPNLPAMINAVVDDVKTKPGQANRKILTGTFDYSPQIGAMITKGDLLFGIHQQQFYQGYLPVVLLTLKKTRGLVVQEPIVVTGPAFVTAPQVEARKCELAPVCKVRVLRLICRTDVHTDTELQFLRAAFDDDKSLCTVMADCKH